MHIIQKSNVLNIKRKTWGSVSARREQPRPPPRRLSKTRIRKRTNPNRKAAYLTAAGEPGARPALSLEVMVAGPKPSPPRVANLLHTRGLLPLKAQASGSPPARPPAAASAAQSDRTNTQG